MSPNPLGPPEQRLELRPPLLRGQVQAAAMSRQHPLEAVVEQPPQGALLLRPGVPADAAAHLQAAVRSPEVIAAEEEDVVRQERAAPARVTGHRDHFQAAPALSRVAVEPNLGADVIVLAVQDAIAAEALVEARMVGHVV